jgi:hypothetical protein
MIADQVCNDGERMIADQVRNDGERVRPHDVERQ